MKFLQSLQLTANVIVSALHKTFEIEHLHVLNFSTLCTDHLVLFKYETILLYILFLLLVA